MGEEIKGYCWHCGAGLTRLDFGRESRCPACDKATHCCLNCRHYAPGRPNECMEPRVERVIDKDRSNFCDLLAPNPKARGSAPESDGDALRAAAESLFRGS